MAMQVALFTTFRTSRKDPLGDQLARIHGAFAACGLEASVQFSLSDAPVPGFTSSVDRVLKRYPQLGRFVSTSSRLPGGPPIRQVSVQQVSHHAGEDVDFATLLAIAQGVPRSFPFRNVAVLFRCPAFGQGWAAATPAGGMAPGVSVSDSWWVNGRVRSVAALTIVDADAASKRLPELPPAVTAVLSACGKVAKTRQLPFAVQTDAPAGVAAAPVAPDADAARAAGAVARDYRARMAGIVERAGLPHDLPPAIDLLRSRAPGQSTGPKKPVLQDSFGPLGYDCRGETGVFILRRRTAANLTVELNLDVGTWSHLLTASYKVYGLGFVTLLPLPVSKRAIEGGQYPILGTDQWRQLVENLAALVAELDRTFVPEVEAAAGPSPEWYRPEA